MSYQLLKSGTSIGANYRETNRAESRNYFIHKIGIASKESAETQYWFELFNETELSDKEGLDWLYKESTELIAIFTSIGENTKLRDL
jgi:four helix bundle protein